MVVVAWCPPLPSSLLPRAVLIVVVWCPAAVARCCGGGEVE